MNEPVFKTPGTRRKNPFTAIHFLIAGITAALFVTCDLFGFNNYAGDWVFLSQGNIMNILNQVSTNAIIAFAMTLAIIILGIDLSVGSVVALSGVVLCLLTVEYSVPFYLAMPMALALGLAIGLANGFFVARFGIPAFVVTLASMIIVRGLALLLVDGIPIFNADDAFLFIGNGVLFGILPMPVAIMIVIAVPFFYLTRSSIWGRRIYAVGGNEEAARLAGINVFRTRLLVYALTGLTAAVSGVILASRLGSGQPNAGDGYELDAITASIIGGTNLNGGVGTMGGTLAGAILIGIINSGMNSLGISPYWQLIMKATIILVAVIIDCNQDDIASLRRKKAAP